MKNKLTWLLPLILFSISVVTSVLLIFDFDSPEIYRWLYLLPLSFGVFIVVFISIFNDIIKNPAILIILGLYFIRNVITPLFMYLGDYQSYISITDSASVKYAILLMLYETFAVFLTIKIFRSKNHNYKKTRIVTITKRKVNLLKFFLGSSLIFCVVAYVIVPEIRDTYVSAFNSDVVSIYNADGENIIKSVSGIQKIIFTLFTVIFGILQIYIPVSILIRFKDKFNEKLFTQLIIFLMILSPILIASKTTSKMHIFIQMATIILISKKINVKATKRVLVVSILVAIIPLISIASIKSSNANLEMNAMKQFSVLLQAYLPGVSNMAAIFTTVNTNKLMTFFYDLYSTIPFRNTIFGLNEGLKFGTVFNLSNSTGSQIPPNIGYGYHYIGFFLSPIVSVFFAMIALKYESKMRVEKNIWNYSAYSLIMVYAAVTPVLYNPPTFIARYLSLILPMMILSRLSISAYDISSNHMEKRGV